MDLARSHPLITVEAHVAIGLPVVTNVSVTELAISIRMRVDALADLLEEIPHGRVKDILERAVLVFFSVHAIRLLKLRNNLLE